MIRPLLVLAVLLLPSLARSQALYPEHPDLREYLADPFLLPTDDGFYLYATGKGADGREIAVWFSENLTSWEERPGAVEKGPEGAWNRANFWAPEVYAVGDEFHLYYTAKPEAGEGNAGNRVGLAVATAPGGPFEDRGVVVDHPSLDGTVFTDGAGDRWLFWTTEWEDASGFGSGTILTDRLLSPTELAGNPTLVLQNHGWQEGANVVQHGNKLVMFFSTGGWKGDGYCVRTAIADAPGGPWTEQTPDAPLLGSAPGVIGPGHGHAWMHADGQLRFIFHAWEDTMKRRSPRFAVVDFDGDTPRFRPDPIASP